ncbi:MAG: DNA polymerase III subunit gamma/tau [Dissulfuribacterales bacterium]
MSYLVLARKYRPQRFEDVVRQEHITRALGNAVTSGRLAHAILLSGPRGTGKTTIARILAKCVNCESGPTATPCNKCRSCREITKGHAADVFEIDGASNNKVDNIRELRDNANYMPAHSPYKIYIIDEVHMLSDSAFNALLKILEEPPAHVKFFFATTEPNKIPITILSRCQRHDCRRIDIDAIIAHMTYLCQKENIQISQDGLTIIAREADGSIRDALSLLDLIITSATGDIGIDQIVDVLGGLDRQSLFEISGGVFEGNAGKIIDTIDRLYERGQHMMRLFSELLAHFRNLLVVKIGGNARTLADVSEYEQKAMQEQVKDVSETYINQILDMLFKEENNIKQSTQPKLAVEIAFIRVLQIKPALSLDTLIEKIDTLQKGFAETISSMNDPTPDNQPDAISRKSQKKTPDSIDPNLIGPNSIDQAPVEAASTSTPPAESIEKPYLPPSSAKNKTDDSGVRESDPKDTFKAPLKTDQEPQKTDKPPADSWHQILAIISGDHQALAACLAKSKLTNITDTHLEINFKANQFNINYANRKNNRAILTAACCDYFEKKLKVSLKSELLNANGPKANKKEKKELETEALNHPLVEEAIKLFSGKVVDIKIL